ncbi:MAG: arsenite methyltransferase [Bacteroidetes bacterium]|nr:arsenite methyltransferase [Bacteroidota bacterium]
MELTIQTKSSGCCSEPSSGVSRVRSTSEEIKADVRAKYADVAQTETVGGCGCGCSTENPFNLESYESLDGYEISADLGLGCGIPTEVADIRVGQDVLDLGSGAGIDAFVARLIVGSGGSVTGVDFTPEMVALAKANAAKLGYDNVQFVLGDIEQLPFEDASFDRIISNCVLNLVPNKKGAFTEMYRVLRPEGQFTVSDIVLDGELPLSIRQSAEAYAGCVSGAIHLDEYTDLLTKVGFSDVQPPKINEINFSDDFLASYAGASDIAEFRSSGARVLSITVTGKKS